MTPQDGRKPDNRMANPTPHLLLVDDDPALAGMLAEYLLPHDIRLTAAASGAEMTQAMTHTAFDLVLMDLRLRGENGLQLARKLRETLPIPIIMLTGQLDEADRVMGLELAADDYVTKPFSLRELLARIRAVLRRYEAQPHTSSPSATPAVSDRPRGYRFDGWELNLGLRRLRTPNGREIELSLGEFGLLHALCRAPGRVLSRDQLLGMTRLDAGAVYDRAIDVQILRLRRKIEVDPARPRYIRTERGLGYLFDVSVAAIH